MTCRSHLAAVVLIAATSCNQGPTLYHVQGTVTYDGKPLPAGTVTIESDTSKGNDGPQGFAHVKDGQFDTREPGGRPCSGGPCILRINGFDGQPRNEFPKGRPLFSNFQEARDLPRTDAEENFVVPAGTK
jgi:hypothetical protein